MSGPFYALIFLSRTTADQTAADTFLQMDLVWSQAQNPTPGQQQAGQKHGPHDAVYFIIQGLLRNLVLRHGHARVPWPGDPPKTQVAAKLQDSGTP